MDKQKSGGIGFTGALQLLLIALRLTGHIDWPWWLVCSPTLVCVGLVALTCVAAVVAALMSDR